MLYGVSVSAIAEAETDLLITDGGITLTIPNAVLNQIRGGEVITISFNTDVHSDDQSMYVALVEILRNNLPLEIIITVDGETLTELYEPLTVTFNLSDKGLTDEEFAELVYELTNEEVAEYVTEYGIEERVNRVTFDPETELFTLTITELVNPYESDYYPYGQMA